MWVRSEVKAAGKAAFRANYWRCVLVAFLITVVTGCISGATSASTTVSTIGTGTASYVDESFAVGMFAGLMGISCVVAILVSIFLIEPFIAGCRYFFLQNTKAPADIGEVGRAFTCNRFGNFVLTLFMTELFQFLWALLFVIPGIIKGYSYRMVPYIIAENPEMNWKDAITLSRQMMDGNKWKTFVLDLSFLGWALLSVITLGVVGIFWYEPYALSTNAALYRVIKGEPSFGEPRDVGPIGYDPETFGDMNNTNSGTYQQLESNNTGNYYNTSNDSPSGSGSDPFEDW